MTYAGVDPVHEPILIASSLTMMGGVDTDDRRTSPPGLYAAARPSFR